MIERRENRLFQVLGGLALGAVCALALKALIWLLPLMLFVGD